MICPNCGHTAREGAKFCEECGIVLPVSSTAELPRSRPAPLPNTVGRRVEPYQTQTSAMPSDDPPLDDPSGTTMLPPPDARRARRTFALVALALVLVLCCCCGLAAASLYYLSQQPPSVVLFSGLG
jgi:hypothetical protein